MSVVKIKSWLVGLCVLALVGCGGGGSAGDPLLGDDPGAGSTAASVDVSTSGTTLGDGESTITVTAIVKDAKNVGLANTTLSWGTTAGNLTGTTTTTDSDGKATATFAATDSQRAVGTATISATSGKASGSAVVSLLGTRAVVVTSSAPAVGTDGGTIVVTTTVKDPNNVAIAGAAVSWKVDIGNLSDQESVTNAQGVATATYSPGSTFVQPTATITATSSTASASITVQVTPTTTSIELLAASPSIGTGGEQVLITAFVKDANNIAKVGAPLTWSVDQGFISNQSLLTDSNGIGRATLDAGSNKANRTAVITAVSGAARQTLNLPIEKTKLTYSGPTTTTVGSTVPLTFAAADSKQVAISGAVLTVTSSLGNSVPTTATTDSAGQVSLNYGATKAGTDTITVTGLGASTSVAMTITGTDEDLAFVSPAASTKVVVGQSQTLTVRYRKLGVAQPNQVINLAATIGTLSANSITTDANGQGSVTVVSGFAGSSVVSATLAASAVQASLPLNFIATTPATLVLQVTPDRKSVV